MKRFFPTLLALCAVSEPIWPSAVRAQEKEAVRPAPGEVKKISIDAILEIDKLWTQTPASIEALYKASGLRWLSEQKDRGTFRREREGYRPRTLWAFNQAQEVEELSFAFKDGKLSEAVVMIWNKGDSEKPSLSEPDFNKKVEAWTAEMNARMAVRFENRGKDMASAARADRRLWIGKDTLAQIEYSGGKERTLDPYTGREKIGQNFQGEFIRLRFVPKPATMVGVNTTSGGTAQVAKADLAKRTQREAGGDVFIPSVPMVDQGDKGYCAVATASRVLNYYGIPADQHEMAKVANTGAGGGTNPDEMEDALRKLQGRYKVRLQQQIDVDYSSRGYQRFMTTYNRAAKKLSKEVMESEFRIFPMSSLDSEVLREVRGKGPIYDKFARAVRENIDKGVPLLWGLQLGKFPENGEKAKQEGGGHMRLIIGYNAEKNEVIFSDSWGAGHEKKRMLMPDASAATTGLYTITPSL